jgi:hypothetical protein
MPYTDVFGGSTVQPSDVQFSEITIAASILTYWPAFATTGQVMSRIMKVNASVPALTISMPDATLTGGGQDVLFDNSGANTFTVLGFTGSVIATVAPGQVKYIYLSDASTSAGTWRVTIFGVGSSNLDAAALSGYGLKAITSTINTAAVATDISGNTTVVAADRSKVFVWTGGSGTLTLPTTVGSTSDFAIEVRNQGTGTLTLAPVGGVLIDASATITLSVQESCFVHMGATDWYTVGRGRNTAFNFTQLTKATTGGTTVLTLTEASNVVQKYTGALVSNATITLPAVVQVYYVNNATTGTYTLTFGCSGGGTSIAVVQSQAAILFCDGVNIVNANTSLSSGISSIIFAAGTVTAPPVAIAESVTGFYASGTHEIGVSINGVAIGKFTSSGITMDATNLTNTIAPQTNTATSKPTPVDADELPLADSAATFGLKKLTWANVKATLATWLNSGTIPVSATTLSASGGADIGSTGGVSPFRALKTGVAQFLLGNGGTSNSYLDSDNIYLRSGDGSTTKATLDSAGNLGLGVTPSAWGTNWKSMQFGPYGAVAASLANTSSYLFSNAYINGSGQFTYTASSLPTSAYGQVDGTHRWFTAPSGTAGNPISFTQALTLSAAGNLLLGGTTDPGGAKVLYIANGTVPGTPTGGGVIYVEAGALKYKGSSGTITTLGAA